MPSPTTSSATSSISPSLDPDRPLSPRRCAGTVASLGLMASETDYKLVNIGFAGLVQSRLPYLPA